ncbi:unnamed protein product [Paramecium primaurelia]|uniref:Uncharacterized protein n=1 Tax=Paramecium primaurelia TaxID=5886 RepID=A0A8S1Q2N7_PARPR|nr:unnamed protein product [Paramecium primaurelia]
MQEQIIQESYSYLDDLNTKVQHTNTLVDVFKAFIRNIHQSFCTLSMQLNEFSEQFYTQLVKTPEENELNLFYFNLLSNTIINLSHNLEELMADMDSDIIQPYEDFSINYYQTNSTLIIKAREFLKQVQTQRESLFNKQQDYLKTAYDLEKRKNSKQLQIKADELFVDYRQELAIVNQLWHIFNEKFKSQFDEYDKNELTRTQLTKTTTEKVVSHISKVTNVLNQKLQQVLVSSNEKFSLIQNKHSNEKQPILKNIMRNRTFNIFKVTKQDNFITYEDWIANINSHDKFDPVNLQKFKLTQQMEQQINLLIDLIQQAKKQDYNKQQFQSIIDIDFETLFQYQDTRIKLLDSIIQIIDQSPTDVIVINPSSNDLLILIAKHLILNLQKDQNFNVIEFNSLLNFITQFGMREKNQFITIGQQASEKTFLFYEKNKWQQLLLYLNEKENLEITKKGEKNNQNNSKSIKPKKTQIINLLYQKKRIIKEQMTQEQRLNYLKVLLNLQKICSIMLKLDIKIDYASETIIILSKMCNIRVQDIVLLLEQFESIKIYMEQIQPQSPKTQQQIMEKKRLFYTLKKCLKYLPLSDQLTIVQINKEFSLNHNLMNMIKMNQQEHNLLKRLQKKLYLTFLKLQMFQIKNYNKFWSLQMKNFR